MKKVIIFHISKFGGHNKAAKNLEEALVYTNPQISVTNINGFGYFYPRAEKVINFIYMGIIKHFPNLWGKAYDRKKVVSAVGPLRNLIHGLAFERLDNLIKKHKPDCFVATQAFPCGLVADFKKKDNLDIPLIAIVTDYHPHRFWVHPLVDRYVVACQEAKEVLLREGVAKEKIKILGMPISVKFMIPYPKKKISEEFGFASELDTVLVMGGGLGIGPIKVIAKKLDALECNFQTIVVCGRNKNLYKWFIKRKDKFKKPIFIFGYIENIHQIMDFSDLIITKGGGITISEALAKGLCIIINNPIPGQEERNVSYLRKKEAIVEVDEVEDIVKATERLLTNKKELYALKERAKSNSFIDSSLRIVNLILELMD